jgi:hypothetical protein
VTPENIVEATLSEKVNKTYNLFKIKPEDKNILGNNNISQTIESPPQLIGVDEAIKKNLITNVTYTPQTINCTTV